MTFKRAIPGWIVGLVIIITAMVTLAAVVKTQTALTWTPQGVPESPKSFGQIFFPGITALQQAGAEQAAQAVAPSAAASGVIRVPTIVAGAVPPHTERGTCTSCHNVLSPRGGAMPSVQLNSKPPHDTRGLCTNCHMLAGSSAPVTLAAGASTGNTTNAGQPPTIVAGAVPPHAERGTCTSCHNVVSPRGAAMATIQINSRPPHDNRGLCTNCHRLAGAPAPAAMAQAAATPAGMTLVAATAPIAQTPMPASEGGWNGVEVTPITALTAGQYGVPQGAGLIVAEAEGAAAVAGIKAGDVMLAVNGNATTTLTDFFRATGNGMVPRGTVDLLRKGQRFQAVVDASITVAPTAPVAAMPPFASATPVAAAPPAAAAAMAPPEGEWLGLEVAPISSLTATQYSLPLGLPGLLVVEAEAQAATIGAKAGDVLQFVNGVPTLDMTKFFMATKNGTVTSGTIVLWRKGEQMVTRLAQTVAAPAAQAAAPPANSIPAAQMTPYGQAPPNWAAYPQPVWPGANAMGSPPCPAGAAPQGIAPVAGGYPAYSTPGAGYAAGPGAGQGMGFRQF